MRGPGVDITTRPIIIPTHTRRIPITRTLHIRTIVHIRIMVTVMDISIGRTRIITDIIRGTPMAAGIDEETKYGHVYYQ
jgi:hypothetical protein